MRRPRMSTGAWIFATAALVLAVAAPVSYAAATSTVAIGNPSGDYTAQVDNERQLVTVDGAQPHQMVRFAVVVSPNSCQVVYTPPAGKGLVVTQVTFRAALGTAGQTTEMFLDDSTCVNGYDYATTTDANSSEAHTYPGGLAVANLGLNVDGPGFGVVYVSGYLIPAGQVPASSAHANQTLRVPGMKQVVTTH